jgi:hypothetical protein
MVYSKTIAGLKGYRYDKMDYNNNSIFFTMWVTNKRYTYNDSANNRYELLCGNHMGVNLTLYKE